MNRYQDTTTNLQAPQGMTLGNGDTLNTFETRVKVPASEAVITGLIVASAVGVLVAYFWPGYAVVWTAVAFIAGFAFWWFMRHGKLEKKFDKFIKLAEMRYNIDLPGGYEGGPPEPEVQGILINERHITADGQDYTLRKKIRVDPAKLQIFAPAILSKSKTFGQENWIGKGNIFGETEYTDFTDDMFAAKYIQYKNPKAVKDGKNIGGYEETALGTTWLRKNCPPPLDLPDGFTRL